MFWVRRSGVTPVRIIVTLLPFACGGCDAIPGTDANLEAQAKRSVAQLLIDPTSAQFRSVSVHGETVCGEVNGKNKMGAFVGFSRFVFSDAAAQIEQEYDQSDRLSASELCNSTSEYTLSSTRSSACTRAADLLAKETESILFQSAWDSKCGPIRPRRIFRPTLGTQASDNTPENTIEASEAVATVDPEAHELEGGEMDADANMQMEIDGDE